MSITKLTCEIKVDIGFEDMKKLSKVNRESFMSNGIIPMDKLIEILKDNCDDLICEGAETVFRPPNSTYLDHEQCNVRYVAVNNDVRKKNK
tara:strand:+ start:159 stop:431 length:273 start_codon:yes stop_codon:yes gene_type:complete